MRSDRLGLRLTVLALAPLALPMFFAAPAGSGCGTRQVSRDEPSPTAPSAEAPPAAPETAPETGTETETETAAPPAPAAAPPAAEEPPPAPALAGDYECRFTRGEREFAPAPCAIRPGADGELRLEQTGGPIRLSGTVTEDEAGFRLSGEVTCARGPCPGRGSRDVLFFSQGKTAYSAVLPLRSGLFLNIDLVRKD